MSALPQPVKHWSMASALEQLSSCGFECEAGALEMNDAWRWLVGAAKIGPEFWPGQGVWFRVEGMVAGRPIAEWRHYWIVGCCMDSDTDRRFWTYNLSDDPPAPWHYGDVKVRGVKGDKLRLEAERAQEGGAK